MSVILMNSIVLFSSQQNEEKAEGNQNCMRR